MPGLSLAAPAILSAPVAGLTALVVLIGGTTDVAADSRFPGLTGGSVCATSGPIAGMSAAYAQNARVVAANASARAGDHAVLIAVMTGLAESGMRVANPNDPTGYHLPSQGVGHDHDSLGIFQQRGNWGTAAQRMDPVASTNLFLDALLRSHDWDSVETCARLRTSNAPPSPEYQVRPTASPPSTAATTSTRPPRRHASSTSSTSTAPSSTAAVGRATQLLDLSARTGSPSDTAFP